MGTLEVLAIIGLFILGLALLIFCGDFFVDGASGIAKRFHMPEILIGATIVSLGTTLPEVMVSSQAALMGHGETAYGNAIGSVICNTSLIAALSIVLLPSVINKKSYRFPVIFFFIAAAFYAFNAYVFGEFPRISGIVLLIMAAVYFTITIRHSMKENAALKATDGEIEREVQDAETKKTPIWLDLLKLVGGAAGIAVGADLLVDNGTKIATLLGVPESVIALTMVALGTSLPELVTAITSVRKKCPEITVGNVVGANLLNLVLVSGISTTLSPYTIPQEKMFLGQNASLTLDFPVMFLVMGLMTIPALIHGKMKRWQGVILLCLYIGYLILQFCF